MKTIKSIVSNLQAKFDSYLISRFENSAQFKALVEAKVTAKLEASSDFIEQAVEVAVSDVDIDREIERAIEGFDFSEVGEQAVRDFIETRAGQRLVKECIEDVDLSDLASDAVTNALTEAIEEASVRENIATIAAEEVAEAVRAATSDLEIKALVRQELGEILEETKLKAHPELFGALPELLVNLERSALVIAGMRGPLKGLSDGANLIGNSVPTNEDFDNIAQELFGKSFEDCEGEETERVIEALNKKFQGVEHAVTE